VAEVSARRKFAREAGASYSRALARGRRDRGDHHHDKKQHLPRKDKKHVAMDNNSNRRHVYRQLDREMMIKHREDTEAATQESERIARVSDSRLH